MTGSEVLVRLAKRQPGLWPGLTELRQKLPFISVDFDRWGDSSPEQDGEFCVYKTDDDAKEEIRLCNRASKR